jgi:hypothetical protein
MMRAAKTRRSAAGPFRRRDERGTLMAGLIAAIAIMMIFSTVAFQAWEDVIRRDKEAEMMFRGGEMARGILRYRKGHNGAGPLTLEQLAEPGPQGQYYLRRLYDDPLVKDGKWGLLYTGPNGEIFDPSTVQQQVQGVPAPMQGLNQAPDPSAGLNRAGDTANAGIGLPLAGVKSLCTDKPFRMHNGVSDYSQWLFTFIDLQTGFKQAGGPGVAAPPGGSPGLPNQPNQPNQP